MEVIKRSESTKKGIILLIIGLVIVLSGDNYIKKVEAVTPAQCQEEKRELVAACRPVVVRIPPSALCCQRIRVTHIACVCREITPKMAPLVDANIDYAIGVIERCGRPVPRHFKCGSITTP